MNTPKTKRGRVGSTALFAPFADWSKGAEYYFGYTVDADGNNVTDPDEDQPDLTEWHLEYVGGEIYELEYCPAENCSTTVYRGNIPTRDFFVALMSNVENAPKIDWANFATSTNAGAALNLPPSSVPATGGDGLSMPGRSIRGIGAGGEASEDRPGFQPDTTMFTEFRFQTHDIRVQEQNGEPWFVAADVCRILEIRNSRDALGRLDDDEKGVATTDTLGGAAFIARKLGKEPQQEAMFFAVA